MSYTELIGMRERTYVVILIPREILIFLIILLFQYIPIYNVTLILVHDRSGIVLSFNHINFSD